MLKLVDITKDYKVADTKVRALKGINLEFRKSEFVCILGQSGCGKTTLLNIIGGLDQYTNGDLEILGKSTKNFTGKDWDVYRNHRIGFIFQSYNLIPHQSVLGNVELALTIAGIGKEERRERAKRALERVGLGAELNKRPNQLSGGQMQRVAIARALVNNPDILLADEPTGALDSATSVQIMDLIREISGERLVIMVTHNPELAEQYASRIVRLHDGLVESDSNPYHGEEAEMSESEAEQETEAASDLQPSGKKKKQKKNRARMGFFTALALSARNLLTKKGRTIITAVAGSIGIISVCLVLALSSGFNNYIKRTEEEMLSYYPLQVTENAFDITSAMSRLNQSNEMPDLSQIGEKVYVNSFLTGLAQNMAVQNDITEEYVEYISSMDENLYYAIMYGHGANLTDNLFTSVETGFTPEELTKQTMSISQLKEYYITSLRSLKPEYTSLIPMADYFGNIVSKMPGTTDAGDKKFGEYVLSQYDVVAGSFPTQANQAVLVIGGNNEALDLTLAQLGFLDDPTFFSLFEKGENNSDDYLTIPFEEIMKKSFTLFNNEAVYTPSQGEYPFEYQGTRAELTPAEGEGTEITISGILRLKEGLTYGCLTNGLCITEQVVNQYIAQNVQSKIVQWLKDDANAVTIPGSDVKLYRSPALHLSSYYREVQDQFASEAGVQNVINRIGGDSAVHSIFIYPRDFDTKDEVLAYLDAWNDTHDDAQKITYTDTVGLLMGMMQTMLNAITYVLVAFTAISLIVSSVMIGIITYVSVVERTKEIGVLRSLGARKQDIRNLFNAETFIIGLSAGIFGVVVTYLLSFVINAVLQPLTGIAGLAALPVTAAIIMILISVGLTLISGLIPASAAAKKDPVIALRTE